MKQQNNHTQRSFLSLFLAEYDDLATSRACVDDMFSVATSHRAVDKRVGDGVVGAVASETEGSVCCAEDTEKTVGVTEIGNIEVSCFHDINRDGCGDALWREVKEAESDFAVALGNHGAVLFTEASDLHVCQVHGRPLVVGLELECFVDLERRLPDRGDVSTPGLDAERDEAKLVVEGDICRLGDHLELAPPVFWDGQGHFGGCT